ncbi:hypothetical protein N665_0198s0261 [Sinapis alba]|nr:hypothetical protein N665_0198s0261 [Sinapis alba]
MRSCRALHVGRRKRVMVNVNSRKLMSRLRRIVAPETSCSDEFDGDTLYRLTADHILLLQARVQLLRRISSLYGL